MVYIINQDGNPLMPTNRGGRIRHLLKSGLAKVVKTKPFTVQLLYEVENGTQNLILGIDPGRTNIGVCVVKENGTKVFAANVQTRNKQIPKNMQARKAYRMQHRRWKRRCKRQRRAIRNKTLLAKRLHQVRKGIAVSDKSLKVGVLERTLPGCEETIPCVGILNKEARFNNRTRPEGWLTPTVNHLLQTHLNLVKKISKFLPITNIVLEVNKFAFMALDNPNIKKWQFQKGQLCGKGSVENAVCEAQNNVCLMCGGHIDHYHHIVARHLGGSNTLPNIVGLCSCCHDKVHKSNSFKERLSAKKSGLNKKYGALSVLNQIIPQLAEQLSEMYPQRTFATDGYSTKAFRDAHNLDKDHHIDAYCIACSILNSAMIDNNNDVFDIKQYRRHDRQACQQTMMSRKYLLNGKVVATNRHKATEQLSDSLEEYVAQGGNVSSLTVKEHKPHYKRADRIHPGSLLSCNGKKFVLQQSTGLYKGNPNYYISTGGDRYQASKCNFVANNSGLTFV